MEICGKVWRQGGGAAARQAVQDERSFTAGSERTNAMRACSACAGDYEDPERIAWSPDDAEDEERESAPRASKEEFPAAE